MGYSKDVYNKAVQIKRDNNFSASLNNMAGSMAHGFMQEREAQERASANKALFSMLDPEGTGIRDKIPNHVLRNMSPTDVYGLVYQRSQHEAQIKREEKRRLEDRRWQQSLLANNRQASFEDWKQREDYARSNPNPLDASTANLNNSRAAAVGQPPPVDKEMWALDLKNRELQNDILARQASGEMSLQEQAELGETLLKIQRLQKDIDAGANTPENRLALMKLTERMWNSGFGMPMTFGIIKPGEAPEQGEYMESMTDGLMKILSPPSNKMPSPDPTSGKTIPFEVTDEDRAAFIEAILEHPELLEMFFGGG